MKPFELLEWMRKSRLAVIATVSPAGTPQAALVGFAVTDRFEVIFDTLGHSRKCQNLRKNPRIALVLGGEEEITVQYEGIADEPTGEELARVKHIYFLTYPDGPTREEWPGITYFRVRPNWLRYSNFNEPVNIAEFTAEELIG